MWSPSLPRRDRPSDTIDQDGVPTTNDRLLRVLRVVYHTARPMTPLTSSPDLNPVRMSSALRRGMNYTADRDGRFTVHVAVTVVTQMGRNVTVVRTRVVRRGSGQPRRPSLHTGIRPGPEPFSLHSTGPPLESRLMSVGLIRPDLRE